MKNTLSDTLLWEYWLAFVVSSLVPNPHPSPLHSPQLHSLLLLCCEDADHHRGSAGPDHPLRDRLSTHQLLCWSLRLLHHDRAGTCFRTLPICCRPCPVNSLSCPPASRCGTWSALPLRVRLTTARAWTTLLNICPPTASPKMFKTVSRPGTTTLGSRKACWVSTSSDSYPRLNYARPACDSALSPPSAFQMSRSCWHSCQIKCDWTSR